MLTHQLHLALAFWLTAEPKGSTKQTSISPISPILSTETLWDCND